MPDRNGRGPNRSPESESLVRPRRGHRRAQNQTRNGRRRPHYLQGLSRLHAHSGAQPAGGAARRAL